MKTKTTIKLIALTLMFTLSASAFEETNVWHEVRIHKKYSFTADEVEEILKAEVKRRDPTAMDGGWSIMLLPTPFERSESNAPIELHIYKDIQPPANTKAIVFHSSTNVWNTCSCTNCGQTKTLKVNTLK